VMVSCGGEHTLVLTAITVWSCRWGSYGQLGHGDTADKLVLTLLGAEGFRWACTCVQYMCIWQCVHCTCDIIYLSTRVCLYVCTIYKHTTWAHVCVYVYAHVYLFIYTCTMYMHMCMRALHVSHHLLEHMYMPCECAF